MNRIADLLGAGGSSAWLTSKIPRMQRTSLGRCLEFGPCVEVARQPKIQSKIINGVAGCPRPQRPFRQQRGEKIKLFFRYDSFSNRPNTQPHNITLSCLEFPSQVPIGGAIDTQWSRKQIIQLKLNLGRACLLHRTSLLKEAAPHVNSYCSLVGGGASQSVTQNVSLAPPRT